jgi:hypothetical protein
MTGLSSGRSGTYTSPAAVTSQKVGVQGKEDVSSFNKIIGESEDPELATILAIASEAQFGKPPPKAYADFHKSKEITTNDGIKSMTWIEFYKKAFNAQDAAKGDTNDPVWKASVVQAWLTSP